MALGMGFEFSISSVSSLPSVCGTRFQLPALRRQRQADLCEFEENLGYPGSSRRGSKATEKPSSKKKKERKKKKKSCLWHGTLSQQ